MITVTEALAIVTKKGLNFECYSTCFDRWGDSVMSRSYFGYTLGKGVWYWFWILSEGEDMIFDHAYSQNNGRTYKGYTYRDRAYKTLS